MGVDPARLPEDPARSAGRRPAPRCRVRPAAGFDASGFERNGVDRIPEGDRTSTPGTFFVIFIGGSVGLGAVAFGWVGLTVRARACGRRSRRSPWAPRSGSSC